MNKADIKQPVSPEFDFFIHSSLTKYQGQYVAILGKKVVGHGPSAKKVWEAVRKKFPQSLPTIAKVPKKEVLILIWK